jgi:hypothetical protein
MVIAAVLVAIGGVAGVAGIRNPRKQDEEIHAESCPGGQLVGASSEIGGPAGEPEPARA